MTGIRIIMIFVLVHFFEMINCQSLVDKDLFKIKFFGNINTVQEFEYTVDKTDTLFHNKYLINNCPSILTYDSHMRLKYSRDCSGEIIWEFFYIYDKNGNRILEKNSLNRNENKFDKNRNLIEHKIGIDKNGTFGKWVYKYDKNQNQIERTGYIMGDFTERWIHKYDKNGNRIAELMVGEHADSVVDKKRIFEYNINRNIIRQLYIAKDSVPIQWEFLYKYDKYNNLIETKEIDKNGDISTTTYQYKYDKMNNWVEKFCFVDGFPSEYFERKIKYK